jgi:PIN domain nuclease of toxin-antitoxin system
MKLLLDTHIFLALIEDGAARLPAGVASLLRDGASEHHLSAASLWEIAIKCRLGKLRLSISLGALPELLDGLGVKTVVIDERHALASVDPEPKTRDPFDRMLLA